MSFDKIEAKMIMHRLMNNPVAPGAHSHIINVGTTKIINTLEENYFKEELPIGISCFKYLQGYYGSGKTQFINSLTARAWENDIVTAIANVGTECPFNSPLAIYRAVVSSFVSPPEPGKDSDGEAGIEILFRDYIKKRLREYGLEPGQSVPHEVKQLVEQPFVEQYIGAPDMQAAIALQILGQSMLNYACGGENSPIDHEIILWLRGEQVTSKGLRDVGLHKPAKDENAFNRLKTIIAFMNKRMGVNGYFIAFDEGTRTVSFRRGSIKQKQAIENLLTMINDGADGKFPGVMFLYSATPDFRSEVISKYPALNDRIGDISFKPGSPMVPFIDLDALDTDSIVTEVGQKLLEVFSVAQNTKWDMETQLENINALLAAEKTTYGFGSEIRRAFVYHFCILLRSQQEKQVSITQEDAENFIQNHEVPGTGDDEE